MPKPRRFVSRKAIDNTHLFKRVSQIFGIPVKELKPILTEGHHRGLSEGHYNPGMHTFALRPGLSLKERANTQSHEERHAVQKLVGLTRTDLLEDSYRHWSLLSAKQRQTILSRLHSLSRSDVDFIEFTDPLYANKLGSIVRIVRAVGAKKVIPAIMTQSLLSFFYPKIALGILPVMLGPKFVSTIISEVKFRSIFRNHGEDGLILLWANPPRDKKGIATIRFGKWEKEMIQKGYLLPRGGFTRKGLQFLREKVQTALIWKRLHNMEHFRKALQQVDERQK